MGFREAHEASSTPDATPQPAGAPSRGRSAVLWLACAAQFMVVLDVSVVNVALPSIEAALGFDSVSLQWVVGGYALVFAGFLLLGGRLADLYGRRRVFLWGLALFTASSLVGGLATTPGVLIAMRAVQGLGAAVLAPATLTILTTTFTEGPARTRALATWTAVSSAGGAAGNLLGGVLTDTLSWRSILLINVPIGAAAVLAAVRLLPADHARSEPGKLDLPGALLATLGVSALVHGVTQAGAHGWRSPAVLVGLSVGVAALAAFAAVETRYATAPLLPPRLLRMRPVWAGNVVMLLAGACFIPMWYFLSLYMQGELHYGALATGAGFLPHTLVGIAAARLAPAVMRHAGPRTLIMGSALLSAAGFVWQSRIETGSGYLEGLLGPAVVMSAGMGLLITPITTTVTSGIPEQDAGAASGLMNATRQIGGALGLAALVTLAATTAGTAASYRAVFLTIAAVCTGVAALALTLPAPHGQDER
ncbi:MFS transporter [Streptomyces rapamycinicus]|uniref:Resistance efflux protein n=2 Tax=Streptomyces rapamycinicus TaxID=1226757 RepID=A0A3L8RNN8_STRRN|nr:MFS transporter [Streptomyces rapamycinicus]MBB4783154.1 EmrB/QacA subfamily drug resistance transporter [Streptomyces rapamycinicus]RLV81371.1 resistance efflux protein [Streptomyces rapamycinicus NRRL 5491]UTO63577.1 MFS transporter [Streptomyces rapamycinicus]UTP31533.1 MFS transporter [Streptomyces rapamycinicus NRRL 5491]